MEVEMLIETTRNSANLVLKSKKRIQQVTMNFLSHLRV